MHALLLKIKKGRDFYHGLYWYGHKQKSREAPKRFSTALLSIRLNQRRKILPVRFHHQLLNDIFVISFFMLFIRK
jgi:hypothetical protein